MLANHMPRTFRDFLFFKEQTILFMRNCAFNGF